jgi:hypothetical protein
LLDDLARRGLADDLLQERRVVEEEVAVTALIRVVARYLIC